MPGSPTRSQSCGRTRREFLLELGVGFTGLAHSSFLGRDGQQANVEVRRRYVSEQTLLGSRRKSHDLG